MRLISKIDSKCHIQMFNAANHYKSTKFPKSIASTQKIRKYFHFKLLITQNRKNSINNLFIRRFCRTCPFRKLADARFLNMDACDKNVSYEPCCLIYYYIPLFKLLLLSNILNYFQNDTKETTSLCLLLPWMNCTNFTLLLNICGTVKMLHILA